MLFPVGTRVRVTNGAYCIEYHRDWDGPVRVSVRQVGWPEDPDWPPIVGFVTPINHARELRDPANSTRIVDENTGAIYMFVDSMAAGKIEEIPLPESC